MSPVFSPVASGVWSNPSSVNLLKAKARSLYFNAFTIQQQRGDMRPHTHRTFFLIGEQRNFRVRNFVCVVAGDDSSKYEMMSRRQRIIRVPHIFSQMIKPRASLLHKNAWLSFLASRIRISLQGTNASKSTSRSEREA